MKHWIHGLTLMVFFLSSNIHAAMITTTFDSLEVADSARHSLASYIEAGLTFTGVNGSLSPQNTPPITSLFYDGQMGQAYQGSAAVYTLPRDTLTVTAKPGTLIKLVSVDIADLCGGGIINSQCQSPGQPLSFSLRAYDADLSLIYDESNLIGGGVAGGFQLFNFPELISGLGVHTFEIHSVSSQWLQIDNLVYETSPVPVPAAVWLFGSGLIGLFGFRCKIPTRVG